MSIYPEAICLHLINTLDTPLRTPKRLCGEAQLLITMPLLDGEAVRSDNCVTCPAGASMNNQVLTPQKSRPHNPVACHAEFVRRLKVSIEEHCMTHLKRQARQDVPGHLPGPFLVTMLVCLCLSRWCGWSAEMQQKRFGIIIGSHTRECQCATRSGFRALMGVPTLSRTMTDVCHSSAQGPQV